MTQLNQIVAAVKANPEWVLLLGAAVALILRKSTSAGKPQPKRRRASADSDDPSSTSFSDYVGEAKESASEYMDAAKKQATRTIKNTKKSAQRFADNQPIGLALGGLAAGVMLAAIFPSTELEQSTLGPIGRRAVDMADDAKAQVKEMARAVGDGVKYAARESMAEAAQQIRANLGGANG